MRGIKLSTAKTVLVVCIAAGIVVVVSCSDNSNMPPANAPNMQQPKVVKTALAHRISSARDFAQLALELEADTRISDADRGFTTALIHEFCYGVGMRKGWFQRAEWVDPSPENNALLPFSASTHAVSDNSVASTASAQARTKLHGLEGACDGFKTKNVTSKTVIEKWQQATAAGDIRSRAALSDIESRLNAKTQDVIYRARGFTSRAGAPTLESFSKFHMPDHSAAHQALLIAALQTKDAATILNLGPTLSASYESGRYIFGEGKEALLPWVNATIWQLIACDFGHDCSPEKNQVLLRQCAKHAECEYKNLADFYLSAKFNPAEKEQYKRLKPKLLQAFNSGDFSVISFVPYKEVVTKGFTTEIVVYYRVPFYFPD